MAADGVETVKAISHLSGSTPSDGRINVASRAAAYGLRDFLTDLFVNLRLVLIVFLIPVGATIAFAMTLSPVFEGQARILILLSREHLSQPLGAAGFALAQDIQTRIIRAEGQILKSRTLRENVVREFGVPRIYPNIAREFLKTDSQPAVATAAEEFADDLTIEMLPNTNVVELRYRHPDRMLAADVLNRLIDLYLKQRHEVFVDIGPVLLTKELKDFEHQIAELDRKQRELLARAEVTDFVAQKKTQIEQLAALELEQTRAMVSEDSLRTEVDELVRLMETVPENVEMFYEDATTDALNNTIDMVRRLEMERAERVTQFREDSRFIRDLNQRIAQAQQILADIEGSRVDRGRQGRNTVFDQLQRQLILLQSRQKALTEEVDARAYAILDAKERSEALSALEAEYLNLQLRQEILVASYKAFATRLEQERVSRALEKGFEDPSIRVIERASPPVEGSSIRIHVIVIGIVAGVALAAVAIYLASVGSSVMTTPEQAQRMLQLPVLMSIQEKDWRETGPMPLFQEASRLFFVLNPPITPDRCVTIQFLGPTGGEGVSTLAREFASVAAQQIDGNVLLLDVKWKGRLQYETIAREDHSQRFGRPGPPLRTSIDPATIWNIASPALASIKEKPRVTFHRLGRSNLFVTRFERVFDIPSGTPQINNASPFWESLGKHFRLAIIDSPPLTESFDGLGVSRHVNATILAVSAEETRRQVAETARDRILASNGHIAGVILNHRRMHIPRFIYKLL